MSSFPSPAHSGHGAHGSCLQAIVVVSAKVSNNMGQPPDIGPGPFHLSASFHPTPQRIFLCGDWASLLLPRHRSVYTFSVAALRPRVSFILAVSCVLFRVSFCSACSEFA